MLQSIQDNTLSILMACSFFGDLKKNYIWYGNFLFDIMK